MINCTFENNNKASLRHVTVKSIVINDKNQILLTKRALSLSRGGKLDLPGGFMERDEDTRSAALRELQEETGITGKIRFLFLINDSPKRPSEDRQNVEFLYVIDAQDKEFVLDEETSEAKWYSLEDIPKDEEFAFDHRDAILKYLAYLKNPCDLPIVG